jgi:four helix bundle protein
MRDFRSLQVWTKAHRLTLAVYATTSGFPRGELYGLTSQIRRSATSIPANIAEGCGRNCDAELARFMQFAMGSASELEYHLLLAHDPSYLQAPDLELLAEKTSEAKRMLAPFINRLRSTDTQTTKR